MEILIDQHLTRTFYSSISFKYHQKLNHHPLNKLILHLLNLLILKKYLKRNQIFAASNVRLIEFLSGFSLKDKQKTEYTTY